MITLNDMYKEYIDCTDGEEELQSSIRKIERSILNCKLEIELNRDLVIDALEIVVYNYAEYNLDIHDESCKLKKDVIAKLSQPNNRLTEKTRRLAVVLLRLVVLIGKLTNLKEELIIVSERSNMTWKEFKTRTKQYYIEVQTIVLDGNAYIYSNNIGELLIDRIKNNYDPSKGNTSIIIDYNETRLKKEELLAKGCKLYNKEEEAEYIKRGVPYDGARYLVFKTDLFSYHIVLKNRRIKYSTSMKFTRTNNTNHLKIDDIRKLVTDKTSIINLQADIFIKLKLMLELDNSIQLKFIRNERQETYNRRKNYRKD